MSDVLEIHGEHRGIGVCTRKVTQGHEFEMVKAFIEYRKNKFTSSDTNRLSIFIEPKVNQSYPDIVFVEYNPNGYEAWNESRLMLTTVDFKVLYHIHMTKQIESSHIVSQLGLTWKETAQSVERLYDAKFILRRDCRWRIRNKNIFSVKKIEAVEAKINKLDSVFQQALINKNFASESYVLSNMGKNIKEDKLERYNKFGVGLYSQNSYTFETIATSTRSPIPVSFNSIYFNEWIGRVLMTR